MRKLIIGLAVIALAFVSPGTASAHHGLGYGYNTDWVSVADRTGPFPVDGATITWDNGLNTVNLTYRWWDCESANGCIMIWENPNLGSGTYGVTQLQFHGSGQFRGANIQLNANAAVSGQQKLKTTCHEIGHGLALNEHPSAGFNGSCMRQGASPPIVTYPDWHDFAVVNSQN